MTHRGPAPFGDPAPCVRQRCVHTTLCRLPDGITPRGTVSCRAGLTARSGGPGPLTPARRGQVLGQGASAHAGATASAGSPLLPEGVRGPGRRQLPGAASGPGAEPARSQGPPPRDCKEWALPRPPERAGRREVRTTRGPHRGPGAPERSAATRAGRRGPRTPEASAVPRAPRALLGGCTATESERDPGPACSSPAALRSLPSAHCELTASSLKTHVAALCRRRRTQP